MGRQCTGRDFAMFLNEKNILLAGEGLSQYQFQKRKNILYFFLYDNVKSEKLIECN